jgi:hypothetical protein
VTLLEECITEEERSVVRFCGLKDYTAKDINKEVFSVFVGKCLSRVAVPL